MKEARRADLRFIHQKMIAAANALHYAAETIGVAGLIDYADRVVAYVARCGAMLEAEEDFTDFEPHNDALSRLRDAEAGLAETKRELEHLRATLGSTPPPDARDDPFDALAYARVESDLRALGLWVANASGQQVPVSGDGTLRSCIRHLRAQREQVALLAHKPALHQPPSRATEFPQSFAAAAEEPYHDTYPFPPERRRAPDDEDE